MSYGVPGGPLGPLGPLGVFLRNFCVCYVISAFLYVIVALYTSFLRCVCYLCVFYVKSTNKENEPVKVHGGWEKIFLFVVLFGGG